MGLEEEEVREGNTFSSTLADRRESCHENANALQEAKNEGLVQDKTEA